jgi:hypothetical protein
MHYDPLGTGSAVADDDVAFDSPNGPVVHDELHPEPLQPL